VKKRGNRGHRDDKKTAGLALGGKGTFITRGEGKGEDESRGLTSKWLQRLSKVQKGGFGKDFLSNAKRTKRVHVEKGGGKCK